MSYANWASPDKTSGNGNESVNVTAIADNTGRNARQTTLTYKAANCPDQQRVVGQKGKPETSSIQQTAATAQQGGIVTVTGVSNSSKLTFSLGSGDLELAVPSTFVANGINVSNGTSIPGDPGANQEYNFSISFTVSKNTGIAEKSRQIIATDNAGNQHVCTLTIAAGEAYLRVSPESIELPWKAGEASATFTVESNTNWVIE